jgi:hypothetical protein
MKKLALVLVLALATSVNAQTKGVENPSKGFNFELFQKTLTSEMLSQFPGMVEDTTINYIARAKSREEAGNPMSYTTKKGGMIKLNENEKDQAKRLVSEYKEYVFNNLHFDENSLKSCKFTEFAAVATKQYGGLIRYSIIIDNNITEEDLIMKFD